MSIIWIFLIALGFPLYLFILWRRLKEDAASQPIFSVGFYVTVGIVLALLAAYFLKLSFFGFWFGAIGAFLGFLLGWYRFKFRFFELFEALVLGLLYWLTILFLVDAVLVASFTSLAGFVFLGGLIFLFYFLEDNYRRFTWYRSGKVGFAGLTALSLFFFVRAVVAAFELDMLSLVGRNDSIFSGLASFVLLITLFNLARQKV